MCKNLSTSQTAERWTTCCIKQGVMNGVSVCVDGGEPGTHNCLVCIDRAAARTHLQAQALRLYKRQTDGQTERQRRSAGGWGLLFVVGDCGNKRLLEFYSSPSERACKEGERDWGRESKRERLLALLQRMMSWSMTSPCSVITAPPSSSSSSHSLLPCIPFSHSLSLSLYTHPNREGAASLIRARMIDKERERGREKVGWKKRTKTTTMEAKLALPCAKVAATV